jgi:hypothetical protein
MARFPNPALFFENTVSILLIPREAPSQNDLVDMDIGESQRNFFAVSFLKHDKERWSVKQNPERLPFLTGIMMIKRNTNVTK